MTETRVEMAKRHYESDMLLAGTYGTYDRDDNFKGCSVGCMNLDLGNDLTDHEALAEHWGVPLWSIWLQDKMFEGLPAHAAKEWHVRYAEACEGVTDWDTAFCSIAALAARTATAHEFVECNLAEDFAALCEERLGDEAPTCSEAFDEEALGIEDAARSAMLRDTSRRVRGMTLMARAYAEGKYNANRATMLLAASVRSPLYLPDAIASAMQARSPLGEDDAAYEQLAEDIIAVLCGLKEE